MKELEPHPEVRSDLPVDAQTMKAELKKLSARAMQLKMDLHDLSEELPRNWELIPGLAEQAHRAFAELHAKRAEIEALGQKAG